MASWEMAKRLDFIDYRFLTKGYIRRSDLTKMFGVGPVTASADISQFLDSISPSWQGTIKYNGSSKRYEAKENYHTVRKLTGEKIAALRVIFEEKS